MTDRTKAIEIVTRMVANGYSIGLGRTVEQFVDQYPEMNWERAEAKFNEYLDDLCHCDF